MIYFYASIGTTLGHVLLPWLIMVLWLRRFRFWWQTPLYLFPLVMLVTPLTSMGLARRAPEAAGSVGWISALFFGFAIYLISVIAKNWKKADAPSSRWAHAGGFVLLFVLSVSTALVLEKLDRANPAEQILEGVVILDEPEYVTALKNAFERKDRDSAYQAAALAWKHRDIERVLPMANVYAELGNASAGGIRAFILYRLGDLKGSKIAADVAADQGDILGMQLVLEHERIQSSDEMSERAQEISLKLVAAGERTEYAIRCFFSESDFPGCHKTPISDLIKTPFDDPTYPFWISSKNGTAMPCGVRCLTAFGMTFDELKVHSDVSWVHAMRIFDFNEDLASICVEKDWVDWSDILSALRYASAKGSPEAGYYLHEASIRVPESCAPSAIEGKEGLLMAARWAYPPALKRMAGLYEVGALGFDRDLGVAMTMLMIYEKYRGPQHASVANDISRISVHVDKKTISSIEISVQSWRPGGVWILVNPEQGKK